MREKIRKHGEEVKMVRKNTARCKRENSLTAGRLKPELCRFVLVDYTGEVVRNKLDGT